MERGSPLLRCVAVVWPRPRRTTIWCLSAQTGAQQLPDSTKVGKLLKAAPRNNSKELFPYANSPNNVVFDYTADGVKRSLEDHYSFNLGPYAVVRGQKRRHSAQTISARCGVEPVDSIAGP